MPFTCKIGDSFFLPDGGGRHRYVILTDPNKYDKVVLTNFTDARHTAFPVIFNPKDDKRLFTKRTTVQYEYASLIPAKNLTESNIDGWEFCQLNHVKKIVIGAFQSQHTPIFIIEALKVQYPAEYKEYYVPPSV